MFTLARAALLVGLPMLVGCSALSDFDYKFDVRDDAGDAGATLDASEAGLEDTGPEDAASPPDAGPGEPDGALDCTRQTCCELLEISERTCEGGRDDDCDGLADCADPDCRQAIACCPRPSLESGDVACTDRIDNDCDGILDCAEPGCRGIYACTCVVLGPEDLTRPASCKDDNDNDCDQRLDCDEVDCRTSSLCCTATAGQEQAELSCADGVNNDCDAAGADCADPDCQLSTGSGGAVPETGAACRNQLDDDCDGIVDCKDDDCRAALECCTATPGQEVRESACGDGKNNDCDVTGLDCFDPDCAGDPACCEAPAGGESNEKLCANGKDDDCDGLFDCADPQCAAVPECCKLYLEKNGLRPTSSEAGLCADQFDNDCDGLLNCADPDCGGGLTRCGIILEPTTTISATRWNASAPL